MPTLRLEGAGAPPLPASGRLPRPENGALRPADDGWTVLDGQPRVDGETDGDTDGEAVGAEDLVGYTGRLVVVPDVMPGRDPTDEGATERVVGVPKLRELGALPTDPADEPKDREPPGETDGEAARDEPPPPTGDADGRPPPPPPPPDWRCAAAGRLRISAHRTDHERVARFIGLARGANGALLGSKKDTPVHRMVLIISK